MCVYLSFRAYLHSRELVKDLGFLVETPKLPSHCEQPWSQLSGGIPMHFLLEVCQHARVAVRTDELVRGSGEAAQGGRPDREGASPRGRQRMWGHEELFQQVRPGASITTRPAGDTTWTPPVSGAILLSAGLAPPHLGRRQEPRGVLSWWEACQDRALPRQPTAPHCLVNTPGVQFAWVQRINQNKTKNQPYK